MKLIYLIIMCCHKIYGKLSEIERIEYCRTLQCDESVDKKVCGIRKKNGENSFMLFENECILLKYGCQVDDDDAYGITNSQRCSERSLQEVDVKCPKCIAVRKKPVCGIRNDGDGYRVRIFKNKCKLDKYNCKQELHFYATNFYVCVGFNSTIRLHDEKNDSLIHVTDNDLLEETKEGANEEIDTVNKVDDATTTVVSQDAKSKAYKNIVVVGGSMSDMLNINETVKNFFAATHVFDLPIREIPSHIPENARRMLIKIFGPIKVFKPWVNIPKNISDDYNHLPTLASCFHKCPTKCPDTYAPVCGKPGIIAREPSLMFRNHCFMDVAQCKMFWEDKSWTAQTSSYIESSFLFCLGDELNSLYRFLPLIRTLQHMGRLRIKGRYKYKLRNMRFFNQLMKRQPNIMG